MAVECGKYKEEISGGVATSARPADVFGVVVAQQLRHAHIRHLGSAPVVGQQHIGCLDVAVDDLLQGAKLHLSSDTCTHGLAEASTS